jgi:hypothetical protein
MNEIKITDITREKPSLDVFRINFSIIDDGRATWIGGYITIEIPPHLTMDEIKTETAKIVRDKIKAL